MLNSDLPIKKSEEDALHRSSFAESLASVMINHTVPEGFVIGMYGKWGSGKTSVINMILEQIDMLSTNLPQNYVILRFNPWLCSDPKQLISQFFKQLSTAIKMKQPKLDKVCNFMNVYADAFDIAGALPVAGSILSAVGKVLGKKAKAYTDAKSSDLQKIKNEIIATLDKEKVKIIVTIDDVDRLSNEEIISVFQLVKSLADFPYTIYLLAFDREVVVRALGEVQKGDGAEYLEKVIQVPFELPVPNPDDIYQSFFSKLDSIISISEDKWDKEYWNEMFHFGIKPYLQSVRDVVRLANTFSLKYALLKDETYLIDLLGLTCLQVFEPEVYSRLPIQKGQLCGGTSYYEYNLRQKETEKIQNSYDHIVSGISAERAENCRNILVKLFPKLSSISNSLFEFGYSRQYDSYKMLDSGSIAHPDCFDRYFALQLESGAISQSEIDYLLFHAASDEVIAGMLKLNNEGKITRLLDHIMASFKLKKNVQEYTGRAKLILQCLLLYWHTLENDQEKIFFSMPFDWKLLFSVEILLKVICEKERYNVLDGLFHDRKVDISTILCILRNFESQHNRFTEKEDGQREPLITLGELFELEKIFVNRAIVEFESGKLLDNDSALYIIRFLEQLDEEKAKLYIDKMMDSDLCLAKFISASVGHGKAMSRTIWKEWQVRRDDIKKYVNIDDAYDRMNEFIYTDEFKLLPKNKKENISAFLLDAERKEENDPIEAGIVISAIEKKLHEIEG